MKNVPDILKIRKDLDMTQQEFAAFIGTSQPVVSRWETGAAIPSPGYRRVIEILVPVALEKAEQRKPYREA